jgi:AcrR family transcriptional regulator
MDLLDAAAELLRRDGYAACSMTDISLAAGVTKGGLYFHFSSKDDVCDAVQKAAIAVLQTHTETQDAREPSAVRRLIHLTHSLMRWLKTEPMVGASFRMAREMGARSERFVAFSRAWFAQVQRYFDVAERDGELGKSEPPEGSALLVAAMCVGIEAMVSNETIARDTELVEALADMWALVRPALVNECEGERRDARGSPQGA